MRTIPKKLTSNKSRGCWCEDSSAPAIRLWPKLLTTRSIRPDRRTIALTNRMTDLLSLTSHTSILVLAGGHDFPTTRAVDNVTCPRQGLYGGAADPVRVRVLRVRTSTGMD